MTAKQLSDYDLGYCGGWNDAKDAMEPVITQQRELADELRDINRELTELCRQYMFYVLGPPTFSAAKKYCSLCGAKWEEHWPTCRLGNALRRSKESEPNK